ncbi:unnamed protein product, partial [Musa acuminata subsp. malaccensis]
MDLIHCKKLLFSCENLCSSWVKLVAESAAHKWRSCAKELEP